MKYKYVKIRLGSADAEIRNAIGLEPWRVHTFEPTDENTFAHVLLEMEDDDE